MVYTTTFSSPTPNRLHPACHAAAHPYGTCSPVRTMVLFCAPVADGQRMNPRFKADAMLKPMRELYGSLQAMYRARGASTPGGR